MWSALFFDVILLMGSNIRMLRISAWLSAVFVFAVMGVFSFQAVRQKEFKLVHKEACDLVQQYYYQHDEFLSEWYDNCLRQQSKVAGSWGRRRFARHLQSLLTRLPSSHIGLYTPVDNAAAWHDEERSNGLEARLIEGHWIVMSIIEDSPAIHQDIKRGDEVVGINGKSPYSAYQIAHEEGVFLLKRHSQMYGQMKTLFLEPVKLHLDRRVSLLRVQDDVFLLQVPSFRKDFFDDQVWHEQAKTLQQASQVVIDLRGNRGGNFVAMMRALSVFLCEPVAVGHLWRPREKIINTQILPNVLDEDSQYQLVSKASKVLMETFPSYPCYRGKLKVLIDNTTASVAEIFTNALMEMDRATVLGQPTAGAVVVGVWYDLPRLGAGYSLVIPEATYISERGAEIEGFSILPDITVDYQLKDASVGLDSFILKALADTSQP